MKKISRLSGIIFVIFSFSLLHAQSPDWVAGNGVSKKFPESLYLTGYGLSTVKKGVEKSQAQQIAIENARRNLVEKIRVNIQSITAQRTEETGDQFSLG